MPPGGFLLLRFTVPLSLKHRPQSVPALARRLLQSPWEAVYVG
jgi:hypothetical protein